MRPDKSAVPLPSAVVPPAPPRVARPVPPPAEPTAVVLPAVAPPVPPSTGFNPRNVAARRENAAASHAHIRVVRGAGLTRAQVPMVVKRAEATVESGVAAGDVKAENTLSSPRPAKVGSKRERVEETTAEHVTDSAEGATSTAVAKRPRREAATAGAGEGYAGVEELMAPLEKLMEDGFTADELQLRIKREDELKINCFNQILHNLAETLTASSPSCVLNMFKPSQRLKRLVADLKASGLNKIYSHIGDINKANLDKGQFIIMVNPDAASVEKTLNMAKDRKDKEVITLYFKSSVAVVTSAHHTISYEFKPVDAYYFHFFSLLRVLYQSKPAVLELLDFTYADFYKKVANISKLADHELEALVNKGIAKVDLVLCRLAEHKLAGVGLDVHWEALHELYLSYEDGSDELREAHLLDELIRIQKITPPVTDEKRFTYASLLQRRGIIYALDKNFAALLDCLKKALALLDKNPDHQLFGVFCLDLARAYQLNNKLKKAVEFAKKAHEVLDAALGSDDEHTRRAFTALQQFTAKGAVPVADSTTLISSLFSPPQLRHQARAGAGGGVTSPIHMRT